MGVVVQTKENLAGDTRANKTGQGSALVYLTALGALRTTERKGWTVAPEVFTLGSANSRGRAHTAGKGDDVQEGGVTSHYCQHLRKSGASTGTQRTSVFYGRVAGQ